MKLEEAINQCKTAIKCIRSDVRYEDTEDNFILAEAIETVLQALENRDELVTEMTRILNQWMPLAECSYWDYKNHTCSHTCRGCDFLSKNNRRTESGIWIDGDRYCRLYEDGNAEEDTVFVKIEDLISRHGKITRIIGQKRKKVVKYN